MKLGTPLLCACCLALGGVTGYVAKESPQVSYYSVAVHLDSEMIAGFEEDERAPDILSQEKKEIIQDLARQIREIVYSQANLGHEAPATKPGGYAATTSALYTD